MSRRAEEMGSISHLELIERVAKGDKGAFETLYRQVYPKIYRYLHRVLGDGEVARELGNEVMMEVWKGASGFRGDSKVFTWIWGIARRKVWKVMKKEEGEFRELEDWDGAHEDYSPHHWAQTQDLKEKVAEALSRLSPLHREVIHLAYYQGLSLEEMSVLLGVPVNTVKTRMFYARKKLGEVLQRMGVGGYD